MEPQPWKINSKEERERRTLPPPPVADIGKVLPATEGEEKKVAIMAVLADGVGGGGQWQQQKAWVFFAYSWRQLKLIDAINTLKSDKASTFSKPWRFSPTPVYMENQKQQNC